MDEKTPVLEEVNAFESKISIIATYKEEVENNIEVTIESLNEEYQKEEETIEATIRSEKYNLIELK